MENLKIRVNSEAESKEVQINLEQLGFKKLVWGIFVHNSYFIFANCNYYSRDDIENFSECDYKEITLPELRDLVVLKRNSIDDATHTDGHCSFYVGKDKNYFFCSCDKAWRGTWKNVDILKPIKKPMKEYLRKNNDGEYILEVTNEREAQEPHAKHWIEVPKGSDYLISVFGLNSFIDSDMFAKFKTKNVLWSRKPMKECLIKSGDGKYLLTHHDSIGAIEIPEGCNIITCENRNGNLVYFHWKSLDSDEFFLKDEKIWSNNFNETLSDFIEKNEGDVVIIWSRHTHPEELPFIDDGITDCREAIQEIYKPSDFGASSLNDQYAEIEKVRQSHRTASETADPTIKETLSQRQEQYGSFEDVAMLTEQMVDVMRKGYYEKLAYNQKMALYMICSKMARIVSGNPNHKDSWHDIAGYATLIDNELVSEKDMPF